MPLSVSPPCKPHIWTMVSKDAFFTCTIGADPAYIE